MDIGAAMAKGVQSSHQGLPVRSPPGHGGGVDVEGRIFKLDQRVESLKMQQARQLAMLQTEQELDQADHASTGARMANVRLDTAHGAEKALVGEVAEGAYQGVGLPRITQFGAGAIGLHLA